MRCKQDPGASLLRHFWLMAMCKYAVWLQAYFAEETLDCGRASCAADTGGAVDDDCACEVNDACIHERSQWQDHGCGIATWAGDQVCAAYGIGSELRKSVDGIGKKRSMTMFKAIVLWIERGILQSERSGKVEYNDASGEQHRCQFFACFVWGG